MVNNYSTYNDTLPVEAYERKKFEADEDGNTAVRISSRNLESRLDDLIQAVQNGGGGSSGNTQLLEKVPFTVSPGQENQFVTVPLLQIVDVADVTVFNSGDYQQVFVDIKLINNATGVQIRSARAQTVTVHVEGYT